MNSATGSVRARSAKVVAFPRADPSVIYYHARDTLCVAEMQSSDPKLPNSPAWRRAEAVIAACQRPEVLDERCLQVVNLRWSAFRLVVGKSGEKSYNGQLHA
jgi:hypothetical protein